MKKFLVVLLACAMIFGFASTAMAADTQINEFNDLADQSVAAKNAIMKLAVLGVIEGNEGVGGAFRPADNLTRAEFAKIVCYLTDNVKIADSLATVGSKFSDVSTGNWYTGWVNAAAQSGYFLGDPRGTFRPNANITMQEVVTVALRCAGYTDLLGNSTGNTVWPGNYVSKAQSVGLLDDVQFVGSAAATRADMAVICEAVLGINMVVHINNDIAYALSLAEGTTDPDGFSEIYYISNETNRGRIYETILHKAFDGEYFDLQVNPAWVGNYNYDEDDDRYDEYFEFDETAGWYFADYNTEELALRVSGRLLYDTDKKFEDVLTYVEDNTRHNYYYGAGEELASSYYITGGNTLLDLSGMQVELTVIDGKEICFVDVVSSKQDAAEIYASGSNVYADGKSLRPSDTMDVNNRLAGIDDMTVGFNFSDDNPSGWNVRNLVAGGDDFKSSSSNTFGGRLYLDESGRVYGVKNYDAYNGLNSISFGDDESIGFGIFEKVDSNLAIFKGEATFSTVKLDKDYVMYKDGEQVEFEDLEENDLVYYLGKDVGVKFFLAYAPLEGELTKQTDSKLTIDGTGYRVDWNYYADGEDADEVANATKNFFQFSDDGGETFRTLNITLPEAQIDTTSFGDALYAKAYNFNRVAYAVTNLEFTKIIGVVTKVTPTSVWSDGAFKPRYEEITIYNAEGKSVVYPFTTNFRDGYNALLNSNGGNYVSDDGSDISAHWADAVKSNKGEAIAQLNKGDIVQLTLDKSDNIKGIANYVKFAPGTSRLAQVESSRSRITFANNAFSMHADAIVFSVSTDVNNSGGTVYDDVSTVSLSSLLATDFYATQLNKFDVKSTGDVMVLYMVGDTTSVRFGVHSGNAKDSGGLYYTLNGEKVYAEGSVLPPADSVIAYTLTSGEAIPRTIAGLFPIVAKSSNQQVENAVGYVNDGYADGDWNERAAWGEITSYNTAGKYIVLNGRSLYVTSESYLYDTDEGEEIENLATLRSDNRRIVVFFNRDGEISSLAALADDSSAYDSYVPGTTAPTGLDAAITDLNELLNAAGALEFDFGTVLATNADKAAAIAAYLTAEGHTGITVTVVENANGTFTVWLFAGSDSKSVTVPGIVAEAKDAAAQQADVKALIEAAGAEVSSTAFGDNAKTVAELKTHYQALADAAGYNVTVAVVHVSGNNFRVTLTASGVPAVTFTVTATEASASSEAGIAKVFGEAVVWTFNSSGGYYTGSLNVLADDYDDIPVDTVDTNATVAVYTDDFDGNDAVSGSNEVSVDPGTPVTVYITVVAEDGVTTAYYQLTLEAGLAVIDTVIVSGDAVVGETLTVVVEDADGNIIDESDLDIQWQYQAKGTSLWKNIVGEISEDLDLTVDEFEANIRVLVNGDDNVVVEEDDDVISNVVGPVAPATIATKLGVTDLAAAPTKSTAIAGVAPTIAANTNFTIDSQGWTAGVTGANFNASGTAVYTIELEAATGYVFATGTTVATFVNLTAGSWAGTAAIAANTGDTLTITITYTLL